MKFVAGKILHRRNKDKEEVIFPSSEVTEGALKVWRSLPYTIRLDPSLALIRQEHEKLHGEVVEEQDPLPYENGDERTNGNTIISGELTNISIMEDNNETKPVDSDTTKVTQHNGLHETEETEHATGHTKLHIWYHRIKIAALVVVWILFTHLLMSYEEKELEPRQIAVLPNEIKDYIIHEAPLGSRIGIYLKGPFDENLEGNATNFLYVYVQLLSGHDDIAHIENVTSTYSVAITDEENIDHVDEITTEIVFDIGEEAFDKIQNEGIVLRLQMYTNIHTGLPMLLSYDPSPINKNLGIIFAAVVLVGLYILIVWEVVHRTFAAIVASTLAISVLAVMHQKPTTEEIIGWIDVETLLLLFGMMVIVAILAETGAFDYLAVYAYKLTNGRVWPLINCLSLFTACLSAFLDNVTTILLMTPVTIRLCEVMSLNPVPILITMVIYSNVGGTLTPVGDPPNVIISSNDDVIDSGVNFLNFTAHMVAGGIFVIVQTYIQIRFTFRNMDDLRFAEPRGIQELRQEVAVWQRAAASLSSYSREEDLVRETLLKKAKHLNRELKKRLTTGKLPADTYKATLKELQEKYPIRNKKLLIKSVITLAFVITFFFLHAAPHIQRLSIGWTALLGAVLLLILADREDIEAIMAHVEWTTLLFFAALFVLMEALAELGLIQWIGMQAANVIKACPEDSRLAVAILIVLWVSALVGAFVDNIPLTTMMLKVVISLGRDAELGLPVQPLIWALASGACLGGNGTLIGASANVVCAGVAQQHGYKFTFMDFFKIGFPIMIGHICSCNNRLFNDCSRAICMALRSLIKYKPSV